MMISSVNTASARDVQRNYREVINKVKKTKQPVVVISRNQPDVAIVSLDLLDEYEKLKSRMSDWNIIDKIQARNVDKEPEEVIKDVTEEVEAVRQEMYEKKKASGSR